MHTIKFDFIHWDKVIKSQWSLCSGCTFKLKSGHKHDPVLIIDDSFTDFIVEKKTNKISTLFKAWAVKDKKSFSVSMWRLNFVKNTFVQSLKHKSSCLKYFSFVVKRLTWISKHLCKSTRGAHCVISICHWIINVGKQHTEKDDVPHICCTSTATQERKKEISLSKSPSGPFHCLLVPRKHSETEERR